MTTNQLPIDQTPELPHTKRATLRRTRWLTWAALIGILIIGTYFRTLGLFSWDEPSYRLHPDERFMTDVASLLRVPASLGEYFDSARNQLNPRNHGKDFYVYGLLPQTLTRVAAVMLTPNAALPPTVPAEDTNTIPIPNPELAVPKLQPLQLLLNPTGLNLTDYGQIFKVGRAWSALFDIGSLVLAFLLASRLYGRRVGLWATLLLACTVLPIQFSHFFVVDATTAFFTVLTIYWAVRLAQGGRALNYIPLGLSIGLAMACRVTMGTLALLAIIVTVQRVWFPAPKYAESDTPGEDAAAQSLSQRPTLSSQFAWLVLAGALAFLVFRILQPDAFLGTSAISPLPQDHPITSLDRLLQGRGFFDIRPDPRFIDNYRAIAQTASGEQDWPPSQQWAGRPRFVFALQNMIIWGMGIPLGLLAWAGWAIAGWQIFRRRAYQHVVPWSWIAFYFLWQGGQFLMTLRYYLPLYALFAIFAARLLVGWSQRRNVQDTHLRAYLARRWIHLAGRGALAITVIFTIGWAYAFTRIYTRPHTRITATRWIYANVPPGSAITSESWDDGLPLDLDGYSHSLFVGVETYPYAEDEQNKYFGARDQQGKYNPGLLDQLDQADYIVLSSNRVYASATRLPMRYPALTRYYHALFNGDLGFDLVADITSYPTIFGIQIPDQSAEEAFTVFDHPRVLIFKKTSAYTREHAQQLITGDIAWDEVYKLPTIRAGKVPTALRLTDVQWPSYRDAGTWATLFNPTSLASQVPWLFWLLAVELVGLAMFPLLFRLFPRLPDRGFTLTKTLGLLLVAYAAWVLGSLKLLAFGAGSVWLCTGLLVLLGVALGWRRWAEIRQFMRQRRNALLAAEVLFLVAYLGFVLIRLINPDLWHPARGGEKPMDLAFLTAVVKSPYFPPYDPWFAGGYINYYYFGFVIVGTLVHMTGIVPTTAYNLAVPTLFALTALGAWGVGYNLLAKRPEARGDSTSAPPTSGLAPASRPERRAIVTGIVAAVFVVLLSPLTQAIWYLPGTADATAEGVPPECQVSSYAAQQSCRGRGEWAFWDATRVVGMDLQDSTINEFPFFTFLFADLHAHMMALPLALAALGLMVALIRQAAVFKRPPPITRRQQITRALSAAACLLLIALVVGALRATNTWDFPTYLGLSLVTLALIAWRRLQTGARLVPTAAGWLLSAVGITVGSSLLFAPFLSSFATDYAGFTIWTGTRTPAADFLKINGLWLFLLGSGALLLYRRRGLSLVPLGIFGGAALLLAIVSVALQMSALMLLLPLAIIAVSMAIDLLLESGRATAGRLARGSELPPLSDPYVQLTLPFEDLSEQPDAQRGPRFIRLTTLLPIVWALAALMITLASELVVAQGDIGRMNTVFKFGMQSWVLFALASAMALSALWRAMGARADAAPISSNQRWLGYAWRGVAIVLIAAALVYPITATPARLADRIDPQVGMTLDGSAFMRSDKATWAENDQQFDFTQDAAALDWMRNNITGTPIVLEAHTEAYRWGGRVSIYTGLPTLLGWPWHETQQRSVADVQPVLASRQGIIQNLYDGADATAALRLLKLYGVEYVYVGKLEHALYSAQGLAKFDDLARAQQIRQVYADGDTRIYEVPRGADAPAVVSTTLSTTPPNQAPAPSTLLSGPVYTLPAVDEYAWNGLASAQPVAVLLWLLACYALLALGLPVALLVFGRSRSADGGYAWARLIGLLILGYAVWLPVSLGIWSYNRWGLLWGALGVLALDAAILARLGRRHAAEAELLEPGNDGEQPAAQAVPLGAQFKHGLLLVRDHFRAHRRGILIVEALFLAAFAVMLVLRAYNPDLWQPIWGGEKPFEFGFLNAILRSPVMPPYDPFFSDGKINYYYYGLFLVSLPIKATGIDPAVAFNLVIPTLFAITLAGACALVTNLTGRVRYGLIGGAFVALLGNLAAAFQVGWSEGLAPVRDALSGGLSGFGQRLGSWFVGPSRVIEIPDKLLTINEFPFWSYLFADLHPHLIAMPITLLVIALAFELFDYRPFASAQDSQPTADDRSVDTSRRWVIGGQWVVIALALGALAVTNSWDFPTYALLIAGALAGRALRARGRSAWQWLRGLASALVQAIGIGLAALLLYLPFFQNYQRPAGVNGIGLVHDGSPVGQFMLIYGLYLLILGMWIFGVAARVVRGNRASATLPELPIDHQREGSASLGIIARPRLTPAWWPVLRRVAWIVPLLLGLAALAQPQLAADVWDSPLVLKLVLFALLAAGLVVLLARRLPGRIWFIAWLAVLAWAVSLGVELVYIRDHLDGDQAYRMNTVFKFGLQAWILMAVAAAAALPWLARGLRRAGALAQIFGWGMISALVGLALVFPLVGVPSRLAFRFPTTPGVTLDGLAFMDSAVYNWNGYDIALQYDADAIRWLNTNIHDTPIVLQSSLEFYRAYGVRIAANTGLPTIVSPLHASEQQNPDQVAERDRDVQDIYTTLDSAQALRLLAKYHVGYVYVGPIEQLAYGQAGVAKFDQMTGTYLTLAYRNAGVKIYQVNSAVYSFSNTAQLQLQEPQPDEQPAAAQPATQPAAQPAPTDQATLQELERQVANNPTETSTAFALAQRYRELNRLDDAAAVLKVAALANPNDVGLHHLWGDILRDAGRADEAEEAYREAIQASPQAGNYNKLGVAQMQWGKFDQAIETFKQAIAADASASEPYFHLGEIYDQQGQKDLAIEQYRSYLSIAKPSDQFYDQATQALARLQH